MNTRRLVIISDPHMGFQDIIVPEGDIFVCCGDMTYMGTEREVLTFAGWVEQLPHPYKVVVAGNHDWLFEREPDIARLIMKRAGITYLEHEAATIGGLKFFGSPYTPEFMGWAFGINPYDKRSVGLWDAIPDKTDVLVTHGPARGVLDKNGRAQPCGDYDLGLEITKKKPRFHIFGHIHESFGNMVSGDTVSYNCSVMNGDYEVANSATVIDL